MFGRLKHLPALTESLGTVLDSFFNDFMSSGEFLETDILYFLEVVLPYLQAGFPPSLTLGCILETWLIVVN